MLVKAVLNVNTVFINLLESSLFWTHAKKGTAKSFCAD